MSFRRFSTPNKKKSYLQQPIVWTPKKLMKVQRRLTRWYIYRIRKSLYRALLDAWGIILAIMAYSGAVWLIWFQAIFKR